VIEQTATEAVEQLLLAANTLELRIRELEVENRRLKSPTNRKRLAKREVALMREMHRNGVRQVELARSFDVNRATVSRIVRGLYHA